MKHRVVIGIDYAGKRAEPGDIVDDIPARSVSWLLEQGVIELAAEPTPNPKLLATDEAKPKSREPKSPSKGDE
jgi:hypothetical protein